MQATTPASGRPATTPSAADSASGMLPFVAGNTLLGTIGVFAHEAGTHPLTTTWFRCAFGLLGLSLWLGARGQLSSLRLARRTAVRVLAAGALMVLAWVLFFVAIGQVSAGVATLLFHVQPLWVMLLAACFLNERMTPRRVATVVAALAGLALATGAVGPTGAWSTDSAGGYWLGVALCLVGAFCIACVTLLAGNLPGVGTGVLAWWQCAIGMVALAIWPAVDAGPLRLSAWAWLAGLGLIHTSLAYGLIYTGMARLTTERIVVLQFVYPGLALVIDWLWYGHRLGGLQWAGIALLAAAIGYAERGPGRRMQSAPGPAPDSAAASCPTCRTPPRRP